MLRASATGASQYFADFDPWSMCTCGGSPGSWLNQ
jgi:hypothetical protein